MTEPTETVETEITEVDDAIAEAPVAEETVVTEGRRGTGGA